MFGKMKVDLESDKKDLKDNVKVNGFFFIVYLALGIRFKILEVLKDHNLLENMSVSEIISEVSKIEKIIVLFSDMIHMG